ncbi:unnamed protein product [Rangifer tarandus platyrhynchus]|uniref:Uncharacterized protein n=2 Tax=Rangifer tarandus platyrhynchus TaxID=3082113 RepID=A0ABN8XZY6_RANTA|nr:unnamed protein product [Rangifer tarandus platyrhynchus]
MFSASRWDSTPQQLSLIGCSPGTRCVGRSAVLGQGLPRLHLRHAPALGGVHRADSVLCSSCDPPLHLCLCLKVCARGQGPLQTPEVTSPPQLLCSARWSLLSEPGKVGTSKWAIS